MFLNKEQFIFHASGMTLIGRNLINAFVKKHADAGPWLVAWVAEVGVATWRRPQDVKDRYTAASIIDKETIVFNVKGNSYRLETKIYFQNGIVRVARLGTHAEYDKWK